MKEKIRDHERINHIIESIENIFEFTKGLSLKEFSGNKMLRFAYVFITNSKHPE